MAREEEEEEEAEAAVEDSMMEREEREEAVITEGSHDTESMPLESGLEDSWSSSSSSSS